MQDLSATEEIQDGTHSVRSSPHPEAGMARRNQHPKATFPAPMYAHWGINASEHAPVPTTTYSMSISEASHSTATFMEMDKCAHMTRGTNDIVSVSEDASWAASGEHLITSLSACIGTASHANDTASPLPLGVSAVVEDAELAGSGSFAKDPLDTQHTHGCVPSPRKKAHLSLAEDAKGARKLQEAGVVVGEACEAQQAAVPGPTPMEKGFRQLEPCSAPGTTSKSLKCSHEGIPGSARRPHMAAAASTWVERVVEGDALPAGRGYVAGGAALVMGGHPGGAVGSGDVATWNADVAAEPAYMAGRATHWEAWATAGEAHVCRTDLSSVARVMVSHMEASGTNPLAISQEEVVSVADGASHLNAGQVN
jgi:hypothetical protein